MLLKGIAYCYWITYYIFNEIKTTDFFTFLVLLLLDYFLQYVYNEYDLGET